MTPQRLLLVRDLLLRSEGSVVAVCYRVGFANQGSFSAFFSRAFRFSPRALRQQRPTR
ncbi:MAG TPA: helix-turn-helix domain-containing protein [Candidatus Handelsmanbacteria bacterium]|nr:helix-turn-helix domain-containing protein [Candidatus Handelsmanbacteria bacterium]